MKYFLPFFLFLSGCEAATKTSAIEDAVSIWWCEIDGERELGIFLRPSEFADYPVVVEGDLLYDIMFCNSTRSCISGALIVDLLATEKEPTSEWCIDGFCFSSIEPADLVIPSEEKLHWFLGSDAPSVENVEYQTNTVFALSSSGEIKVFSYYGGFFVPCRGES